MIFTKFGGKVADGALKKLLDFDANPDHITLAVRLELEWVKVKVRWAKQYLVTLSIFYLEFI